MSATMTQTLGQPVPPFTAHAISVSLPTWRDNIGYEEGEKRVINAMVTGYPRFFIHKSIQKLAEICEKKFGRVGERCMLFPSKKTAEFSREFMARYSIAVRLIEFVVCPDDSVGSSSSECIDLHIALFPADAFPVAKKFWQHTGMGISSRTAVACLARISESPITPTLDQQQVTNKKTPYKPHNRHYSAKTPPLSPTPPIVAETEVVDDVNYYLEERYGRNLPLSYAPAAKRALRRRIAGVLVHDSYDNSGRNTPEAGADDAELGPSSRGVETVTEDDVFLYPTGMAAIFWAHHLALLTRPEKKSVCFGFPYTDTLKILEKWGPGCYHFGHGLDSDIDELEKLLEELSPNHSASSSTPPVLALFTEFPSNPLLRSPNLPRLRVLADKYDFLIVIDETIGNFVNISVLPYADIVVSSLTKVFSGDSNVMGGSLVLNPNGRHYATLKSTLQKEYEDIYFNEDAIFMERNSRNFRRRVQIINENAEAICDFLKSHTSDSGGPSIVKDVFYPKYTTRENYEVCRATDLSPSTSAYGGLFSVTFTHLSASQAFFDALECLKGPSLGTSFTLACPYTIIAHYEELKWAGKWGAEEGLVRVSVGAEERGALINVFKKALEAAEAAVKTLQA